MFYVVVVFHPVIYLLLGPRREDKTSSREAATLGAACAGAAGVTAEAGAVVGAVTVLSAAVVGAAGGAEITDAVGAVVEVASPAEEGGVTVTGADAGAGASATGGAVTTAGAEGVVLVEEVG